jgi:FkbM family methyltransferase
MIDILRFVKSSTIIGIIKRFVPSALQNKLFKFSMERNKELLRKTVLEYLHGRDKLSHFLESGRFDSTEITGLWLETAPDGSKRINIDGVFLPDVTDSPAYNNIIPGIIVDTFLFHILGKDDYDKTDIDRLEPYMPEGPYGYRDGKFDVTVKNGDVVVDAGAWIGDFSALATYYGAVSYAFEPIKTSFDMLTETCRLNGNNIHAVKTGLGDHEYETDIILNDHSGSETAARLPAEYEKTERIKITTLDKFATDAHIQKIDFIKADIEGMERGMLAGARDVLREFAPKLAVCTYHLIDDPKILKDIILDANPKYKIVQRKCKLYAAVA